MFREVLRVRRNGRRGIYQKTGDWGLGTGDRGLG